MAMLFSGSNAVNIGAGSSALQNVSGATVMCWIQAFSPLPNPGDIFGLSPGGAAPSFDDRAYIVSNNGTVTLWGKALDGGTTQNQTDGSQTFVAGESCHLAGVFDYVGNRMILYKNGVERFNVAKAFGGVNTSNTPSNGGAIAADGNAVSAFFNGVVDDCRIYSRVLGQGEIQTIYAAQGRDGMVSDLQHRWVFVGQNLVSATVGTVVDLGILRRGITLTGTPLFVDAPISPRSRKPLRASGALIPG